MLRMCVITASTPMPLLFPFFRLTSPIVWTDYMTTGYLLSGGVNLAWSGAAFWWEGACQLSGCVACRTLTTLGVGIQLISNVVHSLCVPLAAGCVIPGQPANVGGVRG